MPCVVVEVVVLKRAEVIMFLNSVKRPFVKALLACVLGSGLSSLLSLPAMADDDINVFAMDGAGVFSQFRYSYFSIGGMTARQIDEGGGSYSAYNYIGVNYKLNENSKLALRIPFYFNTAGFNKYGDNVKQEFELADVVLAATFYDWGYIGPVDFRGTIKLGLPTSDFSKVNKMIAFLSADFFADYTLARYTILTYLAKPRYYFHSQKAFFDSTTPLRADGSYVTDPRKTNKIADFEQTIQVQRDLNKDWAVKVRAGTDEAWYYSSDAEDLEGSHVTSGIAGLSVQYRMSRTWLVNVGVENKPKLMPFRDRKTREVIEEVAFFRPKDNSYTLQLNGVLF